MLAHLVWAAQSTTVPVIGNVRNELLFIKFFVRFDIPAKADQAPFRWYSLIYLTISDNSGRAGKFPPTKDAKIIRPIANQYRLACTIDGTGLGIQSFKFFC